MSWVHSFIISVLLHSLSPLPPAGNVMLLLKYTSINRQTTCVQFCGYFVIFFAHLNQYARYYRNHQLGRQGSRLQKTVQLNLFVRRGKLSRKYWFICWRTMGGFSDFIFCVSEQWFEGRNGGDHYNYRNESDNGFLIIITGWFCGCEIVKFY